MYIYFFSEFPGTQVNKNDVGPTGANGIKWAQWAQLAHWAQWLALFKSISVGQDSFKINQLYKKTYKKCIRFGKFVPKYKFFDKVCI